jgi:peroxiredoxin Q/BCP
MILPSSLVRFLVALALVFVLPAVSAGVDVGDKAPDFELPSTSGGKIRLSDFVGKKNVVLEFYVLDFSPV